MILSGCSTTPPSWQAYPTALEHYTNSLRHDTSKATVWANRSATLLAMGRAEEALRDAQISRSIDKSYAKVMDGEPWNPPTTRNAPMRMIHHH